MYSQGAAILRADLRGVVEEAALQSELFIGLKALPPLPVPQQYGQYPVVKKAAGNLLRNEAGKPRGPGGTYPRLSRAWENDNYSAIEYGAEVVVDDSQSKQISRFFDLHARELVWQYRQVQLAHEIRAAAKLFDTTAFSLTTAATAYTGANLASFDIGYDVDMAKQDIQSRGESTDNLTLVLSLPVFLRARQSTRLQNRIRGTLSTDAQLTLDEASFARALNIKQVLVGRAVYDASKQGAAFSASNIWSNAYMWLGNVNSGTGPDAVFGGGTGFTLFWESDSAIIQVEQYRDESRRSDIIRARQFTDEKIVLAAGAEVIVTQYA